LKLGASTVVADGAALGAVGGADIVLATGSSYQAASDALRGLRSDGRLVLTGLDAPSEFSLEPSGPFFAKRHRIIGSTHNGPEDLRAAIDLVAAGKCTPVVETYSPPRIMDAVERIADGTMRFRAVVVR
jgi:alcohol dehydrogenase/propanol-preferring alcohol dehydrogenase